MAMHCGFVSLSDVEDGNILPYVHRLLEQPVGNIQSKLEDWAEHWSRVWEYPFAYEAIVNYLVDNVFEHTAKILECGTGFTPVPYWFVAEGYNVIGVDKESIMIHRSLRVRIWDKPEIKGCIRRVVATIV